MAMSHEEQSDEAAGPGLARGIRIRRLRLLGVHKPYEVDFRVDGVEARPLGVIAGPIATGKTTILRFIDYVFGASQPPQNPEVQRQVRSLQVEVETPDGIFTLERSIGGKNVLVFPSPVDAISDVAGMGYLADTPSDPQSISQWLLSTVGLQDVELKEAPTQDESGTDHLSFRDLLWFSVFFNERLGSQQLLAPGQHFMTAIKFKQVFDAVFGVYDNSEADLARRIKEASQLLDNQRRSLDSLREFVDQQEPRTPEALEFEAEDLDNELSDVFANLKELGARELAASDFAEELRVRHASHVTAAQEAGAVLRDRLSLIDRFGSLRAQYADDVRKLTLLVEAGSIFNELSVIVCPVCFSPLPAQQVQADGSCSLCGQHVHREPGGDESSPVTSDRELRAAKSRYRELDEYWQRLSSQVPALRATLQAATERESRTARELDEATRTAVSPFLGERTELERRRQAVLVLRSKVTSGLKLYEGLKARQTSFEMAERNLAALRKEQKDGRQRPDRASIISTVSARYAEILRSIAYPKVDEAGVLAPFIDDKLMPFVRGERFQEASSGGQVLVSVAWILAVFEVAYEGNFSHPGFIAIDTLQKNLGGSDDDREFADIHIVERVYEHIGSWLAGAGRGAQVLIVDNTPPTVAVDDVIVRFTRDPNEPPFGLIDNEIGVDATVGHDTEEA